MLVSLHDDAWNIDSERLVPPEGASSLRPSLDDTHFEGRRVSQLCNKRFAQGVVSPATLTLARALQDARAAMATTPITSPIAS